MKDRMIKKKKASGAVDAGPDRRTIGGRSDDGRAFLPDPYARDARARAARAADPLAESLAEEYVAAATTGEEQTVEAHDAMTTDELGGPFVETHAREEFATTIDDMNPPDAAREPFPTANARRS